MGRINMQGLDTFGAEDAYGKGTRERCGRAERERAKARPEGGLTARELRLVGGKRVPEEANAGRGRRERDRSNKRGRRGNIGSERERERADGVVLREAMARARTG